METGGGSLSPCELTADEEVHRLFFLEGANVRIIKELESGYIAHNQKKRYNARIIKG